jgi:hypothetical protein
VATPSRRRLAADGDWVPVELTATVLLKPSQPPQTQIQHQLEGDREVLDVID